MSFAHPLWLSALVIPISLAFLVWTKRGHRVLLPFDHGQQGSDALLGVAVNLAEMLPALLLGVAIFLAAGPRKTSIPEEEREVTNVLFCLDVSGSMRAAIPGARRSTRYDAAMSAIGDFTRYREGDAFGLTAFGNEVWHWVPVTKDTSAIRLATPFLKPEKLPYWMSGTMIGKALESCRKVLNRQEDGDKMIVLVSDGQSGDLYGGAAGQIGRQLKADGIVLYAVHIGGTAAPAQLHGLVGPTGGRVFAAGDSQALTQVFKHIDSMAVAKMKRANAEPQDWFLPFALVGLAALGLYTLSLLGLRYTPW